MNILPIEELVIFDLAHYSTRSGKNTLLSLDVDGARRYSISINGEHSAFSGKNTVGAFANQNKESIFAWIDPVSGEFFRKSGIGNGEIRYWTPLFALPLIILILGVAVGHFGIESEILIRDFLIVLALGLAALIAARFKHNQDKKIEINLRQALTRR